MLSFLPEFPLTFTRKDGEPDNKLSYHKRDLGMLQVMVIYEISIDDALADLETLEKLHRLTDQYDDYQRYSENEVTWPTEATFQ